MPSEEQRGGGGDSGKNERDPAWRDATQLIQVDGAPAAITVRKVLLRVIEGPDQGTERTFDKREIRVGAAEGVNDLVLHDPTVSGRHLVIELGENGFVLRDLESTNGTYVARHQIQSLWLNPRSVIYAGNSGIEFVPLQEKVRIELSARDSFGELMGRSVRMREIFATLERVATKDITVLIDGETGTGKELTARGIHDRSPRAGQPFVVFDCGAVSKNLIESELFGHVKGAFTGAHQARPGAFELAHGGTMFLDEIGDLDLALQPKLLRVLEQREVKRVGAAHPVKVDVRVLAATNRDLEKEVRAGTFREDLFYRLAVARVRLPSLRERRDDIPLLVESFIKKSDPKAAESVRIPPETLDFLMKHDWPGNVRELRNVIERSLSFSEDGLLKMEDVPLRVRPSADGQPGPFIAENLPFKDAKERWIDYFEVRYLKDLLQRNGRNISRSAAEAGVPRQTLHRLIRKHDLDVKGFV
jgi:transcriptional regulator with PAS, ATPase and Fis domain